MPHRARRALTVALVISLTLLAMLGRLAWLQLFPGSSTAIAYGSSARDSWKRISVIQRQRSLVLDTGRGDFLDRYGKSITGESYMTLALFPIAPEARGSEAAMRELAELLRTTTDELASRWDALREAEFWRETPSSLPIRLSQEQQEQLGRLAVDGVRVVPYRNRYLTGFDAKHWIGFTGQHPEWVMKAYKKELERGKHNLTEQVGGTGLEKSLDKWLHGAGETSISYFVDGKSVPLHGIDMRLVRPNNPYYPLQVVTTIDLRMQNELEAYADSHGLKDGAIVVLDASNADIVAMVSRPKLKTTGFGSSDGKEWSNRALQAFEPGSIYKLVTAAAAMEAGIADGREIFHCTGEYGKYGMSCWKHGGHGRITMLEGLAQSCNIVFATLAERLRADQFQRTTEALGVSGVAGWHSDKPFGPFRSPLRLLEEEEAGRLFAAMPAAANSRFAGVDGGVLAQSGIGQRDVRMSPLSAANLIVTLLNDGRVAEPRLVSEIRYADGQRMTALPAKQAQSAAGRIRPAVARTLLRGMEAAVDHGTGRSIRQGLWAVAGKSGTAQTTKAGVPLNHQWFAGYGPIEAPRYAVAVLAANRTPGSTHQATKLFRGVMDILAK